jgi:hypothetical protein
MLYSIGSSRVEILNSKGLKFFKTQKSVVDFQEPVGQATKIIQ